MIAAWIASAVLFAALLPGLPYGYFQILRWVVCACALFGVRRAMEKEHHSWTTLLAATAVLFNPILPIHLSREIWIPIDLGVGIMFLCATGLYRKKREGCVSS